MPMMASTNTIKTAIIRTVLRLLAAMSEYILELDVNGLGYGSRLGFVDFIKDFILLKAQHIGKNIGRENLALGIKIPHYSIIKAARGLDFIFGVGQFGLQFLEVLRGLEVGVVFGHRKQTLPSLGKGVVGLGGFGHAVSI